MKFKRFLNLLIGLLVGCTCTIKAQRNKPFKLQYKKIGSIELDLTIHPSLKHQQKAPAIIFFFGGGWNSGSIAQFEPHAQYFKQRGLTSILVNYRVSSRNNTTPFDAVEDARNALKFIVRNANTLGIDKNKIVVSGGSAGGHLAMMSAFSPASGNSEQHQPAALVLFNPVIDTGPNGYGYKRIGDNYKAISPIDNIPQDPPPIIFFLGTDDSIISVAQANEFCQKVKEKGGSCKLKLYEDQEHAFFNYRHTEYFIDTVREADQFLIHEGIIDGKPSIKKWMQIQD